MIYRVWTHPGFFIHGSQAPSAACVLTWYPVCKCFSDGGFLFHLHLKELALKSSGQVHISSVVLPTLGDHWQ